MKIALETAAGRNLIGGYAPGRVVVNGTVYGTSLVVTAEQIIGDWPPGSVDELAAAHLATVAALGPEIVLLGTGTRQHFPPPAVLVPLIQAGVRYEIMDTGAACRTFNILLAEGRRVAAALIRIEPG